MRNLLWLVLCCTSLFAYARSTSSTKDETITTICTAMDTPEYTEYAILSCVCTILNAAQELTSIKSDSPKQLLLLLIHNASPTLFREIPLAERKKLLKAFFAFESLICEFEKPKDKYDSTRSQDTKKKNIGELACAKLKKALDHYTQHKYDIKIEQAKKRVDELRDRLRKTSKMST